MENVLEVRLSGDAGAVRPIADGPGGREMLLYEALARARMREAEEYASRYRLARRLTAGRRWARLARYAQLRAERARLAD